MPRKPLDGDEGFDPAEFSIAGHEGDAFDLGQSGGEGISIGERETGLDMGGRQSMSAVGEDHVHWQLLHSR